MMWAFKPMTSVYLGVLNLLGAAFNLWVENYLVFIINVAALWLCYVNYREAVLFWDRVGPPRR